MNRFYVAPGKIVGPEIYLTGPEAHHALHVLRIRSGEQAILLDGVGTQLFCEAQAHDRDKIRFRILEKKFVPQRACLVTLLQAVPKGKLIELIIQKATELGVSRVIPLMSERVVVDLDDRDKRKKL